MKARPRLFAAVGLLFWFLLLIGYPVAMNLHRCGTVFLDGDGACSTRQEDSR